MAKIKAPVFQFQPFSRQQKKILTWWLPESGVSDMGGIIADGAIRSGKTVCMSLSFVMWATTNFNGHNFGLCGKTIGSFRRNVLGPLKQMLPSRGYQLIDHRSLQMVTIARNGHANDFYIFGGRDESSQDLVQGITLAGVLLDEVALMPRSFVNQVCARCSVEGSKLWFNCNPAGPMHWFKIHWLDRCDKLRMLHLHFGLDDNLSLSEAKKNEYRNRYEGVFYRRFILGEWCAAEGMIYPMYEDALEDPYNPCNEDGTARTAKDYAISIDYGTLNAFAALLWAQDVEDDSWHIVSEYRYSGRDTGRLKTDEEYLEDMTEFYNQLSEEAQARLRMDGGIDTIVDPSAASFITALRRRSDVFHPIPAVNDVLDGIRDTAVCLQHGIVHIGRNCKGLIKEAGGYVWAQTKENEEDKQDRPIKIEDHCMDAMRYMVATKRLARQLDVDDNEADFGLFGGF